jgi:dihydroflavonol-4-reductase
MRAAVTGGSGVVGGPVIRHLVEAGHEVVALARTETAGQRVAGLGAQPSRGDVLDPESLRAFVAGADWVFHVAGVNEMCPADRRLMTRVNVEGTRHVADACHRKGVGRLIHTSSAVTLGEAAGETGNEFTSHRGRYRSLYEESKVLAERELVRAGDVEVVVVNPSSVQGPGRSTGTGRLVIDVLDGRLPFLVDSTFSIVDIDDCARGHLLAAERGEPGERYVLSGATLTIREALHRVAAVSGAVPKVRYLPSSVALIGGTLVELVYRLGRRRPPVCREMVSILRAGAAYDGSRATRELGLQYRPFDETIRRMVDWFRAQGLVG